MDYLNILLKSKNLTFMLWKLKNTDDFCDKFLK